MKISFVVIDESELDCFIAGRIIHKYDCEAPVYFFNEAQAALDVISANGLTPEGLIIILLDLQMPLMDGYGFIKKFEANGLNAADKYHIAVLSATVDPRDLNRLRSLASVKMIIQKPLSPDKIKALIQHLKVGSS